MVPIVAIDVLPPAPAESAEARAMVRACTAGLSRGRCALTDPREPFAADNPPLAVAIVTWDDAGESALVELGKEEREHPRWLSQRLEFTERDAVLERWRAAGFAVAALAGELHPALRIPAPSEKGSETPTPDATPSKASSSPGAAPEAARESIAATPSREASTPGAFWLAAGANAGPALDAGAWRAGPRLQAGFDFGDLPLFVAVGGSAQFRLPDARELALRWITPNLTAGVRTTLARLDLALRAGVEGYLSHVSAVAENADTGGRDSAARWTGGVRGSGAATWPQRGSVFGLTEIGISWSPSPTTILSDGERVGSTPRFAPDVGAAIGIRFQ